MSYWSTVLEEVLNRHNPKQRIAVTNVRDYTPRTRPSRKKLGLPPHATITVDKNKKYSLGNRYPNIYFTPREAQLMFHMLRGNSNKKMAVLFELSIRTIEFYVNNMKTKLGCSSRGDLVSYVSASEFLQHTDFLEQTKDSKQASSV
jgi:DNA-binding CsgD family transcriptional regulator